LTIHLGTFVRPYNGARRHLLTSAFAVYRELGHLYESWGRLELALAQFEKVVAARPEHASGHIYAGGVLARLGRFDEAMASHTKATQCPEGQIDEAYFNLGLVLRAQERFDEAKTCLERALEIDPSYAEAHFELGLFYEDEKQDAKAMQEYQLAIKLRPDLSKAHYHLGRLYQKNGQPARAQKELETFEALKTRQ